MCVQTHNRTHTHHQTTREWARATNVFVQIKRSQSRVSVPQVKCTVNYSWCQQLNKRWRTEACAQLVRADRNAARLILPPAFKHDTSEIRFSNHPPAPKVFNSEFLFMSASTGNQSWKTSTFQMSTNALTWLNADNRMQFPTVITVQLGCVI